MMNYIVCYSIYYFNSFAVIIGAKFMPQIIKLTVFAFIMLLSFSCKERQNGVIPYVPINTSVGLNLPSNAALLPIGGFVYLNGFGSKGLIIYHRDSEDYVVYDRNCTYNGFAADCNTLTVEQDLGIAKDACCGSKFNLQTGLVQQGPATFGMVQYQTDLQGNTLYISN